MICPKKNRSTRSPFEKGERESSMVRARAKSGGVHGTTRASL